MFLQAFAFLIAAGYSVLFVARSPAAAGPLILAVAVTALIGVPLGLALAALLSRELEGALALIAIIGVQTSHPLNLAIAAALPLCGPVKLMRDILGLPVRDPALLPPRRPGGGPPAGPGHGPVEPARRGPQAAQRLQDKHVKRLVVVIGSTPTFSPFVLWGVSWLVLSVVAGVLAACPEAVIPGSLRVVYRTARAGLRATPGPSGVGWWGCWSRQVMCGPVCWKSTGGGGPGRTGRWFPTRSCAGSWPRPGRACFGELDTAGARSVLRRYSDAWFAAAKRRRGG